MINNKVVLVTGIGKGIGAEVLIDVKKNLNLFMVL